MKNIIAITMGDPAGVGPEIILKTFAKGKIWEKGTLIVVGDYTILERIKEKLKIDIEIKKINDPKDAENLKGKLPILDMGVIKNAKDLKAGKISACGGDAAVKYIQKAVELAMDKEVTGIATAPINKEALKEAGYHYIGHTEMLQEMSGAKYSLTMFMVDKMKIFFHTRHVSLRRAIETLSTEGVIKTIKLSHKGLKSIGYKNPILALSALNPHASDGGMFGDEEEKILIPACKKAQEEGINVVGPIPSDSVFHLALEGKFDAVISLYHDQGHIAAKTYDFYRTVSVTIGLPFLRTSVDHGTAFDIAWKGIANPLSMEEAIDKCFILSENYTQPEW